MMMVNVLLFLEITSYGPVKGASNAVRAVFRNTCVHVVISLGMYTCRCLSLLEAGRGCSEFIFSLRFCTNESVEPLSEGFSIIAPGIRIVVP